MSFNGKKKNIIIYGFNTYFQGFMKILDKTVIIFA